jgi:hypothetical protein
VPIERAIELAKANKKLKPVRVVAEADEDESEELPAVENDKATKHFYIVQQGSYFGVFNAMEATVDLYKTRVEAEGHLRGILHGCDG